MSEERKQRSPLPARSILGLSPPPPAHSPFARHGPANSALSPRALAAASSSSSSSSSSGLSPRPSRPPAGGLLPPVVSHASALIQLGSMFPQMPHDVIIEELERNNRELERTITALLARGQEAEAEAAAAAAAHEDEQIESDESMAKRMQADLDAESARNVSHGSSRGGTGAGAGFGSTGGGPADDLDEDELMRLKLAQFAHREAIYQTNSEGPFAPKKLSAAEAASPAGAGSSRGLKKSGGKSAAAPLSPMERIARDHKIYESNFHNRVASEEEIAAAKDGPKAMRKLQEKREKEAKAMAAMTAMGFTVSRPQDPQPPQGQAVAQANQAMLAARQGAHWNNPHAMAAPQPPPPQLPQTYLSGQRAAASAAGYGAAAAPSAAASASASSASAAASSAFDVEKEHKRKKKSKDKERDADEDAAADGSKKKKKKRDKDKDKEGDGGDEADRKKKKREKKERERAAAGAGAGLASPPAASSSSAAAAGSPVDLVDLLRDYSITPSSRRVDAAEIDTLLKKG